jgi:hypothetical protein
MNKIALEVVRRGGAKPGRCGGGQMKKFLRMWQGG